MNVQVRTEAIALMLSPMIAVDVESSSLDIMAAEPHDQRESATRVRWQLRRIATDRRSNL